MNEVSPVCLLNFRTRTKQDVERQEIVRAYFNSLLTTGLRAIFRTWASACVTDKFNAPEKLGELGLLLKSATFLPKLQIQSKHAAKTMAPNNDTCFRCSRGLDWKRDSTNACCALKLCFVRKFFKMQVRKLYLNARN